MLWISGCFNVDNVERVSHDLNIFEDKEWSFNIGKGFESDWMIVASSVKIVSMVHGTNITMSTSGHQFSFRTWI